MQLHNFNKRLLAVLFALILVVASSATSYSASHHKSSLDRQIESLKSKISTIKNKLADTRRQNRQKIHEIRLKEKNESTKMYYSQMKLEDTKSSISNSQNKLASAQNRLVRLERSINRISSAQIKTERLAGIRLRQIFKGERVSILHLIFSASDINSFLDRVYYQKRLARFDKQLLTKLRAQTQDLYNAKRAAQAEKQNIVQAIKVMNEKKQMLAQSINTSQQMINNLRTNRASYENAERDLASQSSALESQLRRMMITPAKGSKFVSAKGGFSKPIRGIITSPFGWRTHPLFGSRSFHTGVDIATSYGTPVHAANSGRVVYTGWYGGYGKVVIVTHGSYKGTPTSTLYAHLSSTKVSAGQSVTKGQTIGREGTTGYSTGPHLHFEVRLNGKPTNPLNYI